MKKIYALFVLSCFLYGCGSGSTTTTGPNTTGAVAPPTPQNLSVTSGNDFVDLVWEASEGADLYQIYKDDVLLIGITRLSYRDTEVENDTEYRYAIAAVNRGAASSRTPIASATPAAPEDLSPPVTITADFVGLPTDLSAKVSWSVIDNADAYNVYRDGQLIATITTNTYTDEEVEADTQYEYSISAVNSQGEGSVSPVQMIDSAEIASLPSPTGLSAAAGDNLVELSWSAVNEATLYQLYRDDNPLVTLSLSRFTDREVENDQKYEYRVLARNDIGESVLSTPITIAPSALAIPIAPTNLSIVGGSQSVLLAWSAVGNANLYQIYRDGQTLITTTETSYRDEDEALVNGNVYTYTVAAVNPSGEGPVSSPITATPMAVAALPAPGNLSVVSGNGLVNLQWDRVATAAFYQIYRDDIPLITIDSNNYVDTAVNNGDEYGYTVAALDENSLTGEVSASVNAAPSAPSAPPIPTGLTGSPGNNLVQLSWEGTAELYRVYRDDSNIPLISTSLTSYTDTTAGNGVSYNYSVSSVSNGIESMQRAAVVAQPTAPMLPIAPTGLMGTAGDTVVTLAWDAVTDADLYGVYRNSTLIAKINVAYFTDTNLTNDTSYSYGVSTIKEDVEGTPSAAVSVTPTAPATPAAPIMPTGLTATPGDTVVMLSWNAVADATLYRVYRDGATNPLISISSTSYTDTGLSNGTSYDYSVRAVNASGREGQPSEAVTAMPTMPTAPNAPDTPENLMATAGNTMVTLAWDTVDDAELYGIYRNSTLIAKIDLTSFTDTGLTNGTAYDYSVSAINDGRESVQSTPAVSATPVAPDPTTTPTLVAPTGLTAMAGDNRVDLSWDEVTGATLYNVYRSDSSTAQALIAQVNAISFADTAVTSGTAYNYSVSAIDSSGEGARSTENVSATPTAPMLPIAPTGLMGTAGDTVVTLAWDAVTDAELYGVYRNSTLIAKINVAYFTDTNLTNDTSYSYGVSTIKEDVEGTPSAAVSVTPTAPATPAAPIMPTGLTATPGDTVVMLSWNAVADATLYRVYRDGATNPLISISSTSYTDTGLSNGTSYDYSVRAVNASGREGQPSEAVTAMPTMPTAPNAPDTPENLMATAGNTMVTLAWDTVDDAELYGIYRNSTLIAKIDLTSFTDTGLTNGTAYDYSVSAINDGRESVQSTPAVSATPVAPDPTTTPTLVAPTGLTAMAGDNRVDLSWDEVTGATLYNVYRSDSSTAQALIAQVNAISFADTAVTSGTAYNYSVSAIDSSGEGARSTENVSATPTAPMLPIAPTGLMGTAGDTVVTLAWDAVTDADLYGVYRNSTLIAKINVAYFTDTNLTNDTSYSYGVSTIKEDVEGTPSAAVSVTPTAPATPAAPIMPTGLTATPGDTVVMLSWNAVADATLYRVYRDGACRGWHLQPHSN